MTTTLNHIDIEHIIRKHMERQSALTDGPSVKRADLLILKNSDLSHYAKAVVQFEDPKPKENQLF